MENPNKDMIDTLIVDLRSELEDTPMDDKKWTKLTDTIIRLYEIRSDEIAKENERAADEDKMYINEKEAELKFKEAEKDRRNTIIFRCLELGIPTIAYIGMFMMGLNFEKTGYLSGQMFRGFLQKLPLPKGKQPK